MRHTCENALDADQGIEGNETNHQHGREFLVSQTTRTICHEVTVTDVILKALRTGRPIAELLAAVGVA